MSKEDSRSVWWAEEFEVVDFGDKRLKNRLVRTADQLATQPLDPINKACSGWADTKATYRLFANEKVSSEEIIGAHRVRTWERAKQYPVVLAIQDTSFINYTSHRATKDLGHIGTEHSLRGLCQHTTLAMSPGGVPLGVLDQKIWTRKIPHKKTKKECKQIKEYNRSTSVDKKESGRWLRALDVVENSCPDKVRVVTVADRECDIYDFMAHAQQSNALFLIRAAMDRSVYTTTEDDDEIKRLWDYLEAHPRAAKIKIDVAAKGTKEPARVAEVEIRFAQVEIKRPQRARFNKKSKVAKSVFAHAVLIQEPHPPKNATQLEWMLLTNTEVITNEDAIEKMHWYRLRWGIEVFHKVLKSGCRVEECRLGTAERLTKYLALCSIIAWRLHWMTFVNRESPESSCEQVLADHEWKALYSKIHKSRNPPKTPPTTRQAIRWIAQLGGFLGRKGDGEPGTLTLWRGWQRLTDIAEDWILFHPPPLTYG